MILAHINLADLLMAAGQYEDALLPLRRRCCCSPATRTPSPSSASRCSSSADTRMPRRMRQLVDLHPASPMALSNLAMALVTLKQADEAKVFAERALAVNANYQPALTNLGQALSLLGDVDGAAAAHAKALAIEPGRADLYANRSVSLVELGQVDAAIDVLRERCGAFRLLPGPQQSRRRVADEPAIRGSWQICDRVWQRQQRRLARALCVAAVERRGYRRPVAAGVGRARDRRRHPLRLDAARSARAGAASPSRSIRASSPSSSAPSPTSPSSRAPTAPRPDNSICRSISAGWACSCARTPPASPARSPSLSPTPPRSPPSRRATPSSIRPQDRHRLALQQPLLPPQVDRPRGLGPAAQPPRPLPDLAAIRRRRGRAAPRQGQARRHHRPRHQLRQLGRSRHARRPDRRPRRRRLRLQSQRPFRRRRRHPTHVLLTSNALWYWPHNTDTTPWYPSLRLWRTTASYGAGELVAAVARQFPPLES